MLVAGSVIIGMREETEKKSVVATTGEALLLDRDTNANADSYRDEDEGEDIVELDSVKDTQGNSSDDDSVLK